MQYGRATLEGVVEDSEQARSCADLAGRIKGVMDVQNRLKTEQVRGYRS